MTYKLGDRFINITTGTIIEITWMGMVDVLVEEWQDSNTLNQTWNRESHMELTNINDPTKNKRIPTSQMGWYISLSNGKIQPYHNESIKPINYIKQHKLITSLKS